VDLFDIQKEREAPDHVPLAERMRPKSLDELMGQDHVTGSGGLIRQAVEKDRIFSMILWGPPGCGKTTLARIIARQTRSHFLQFSAVLSGVKEIRAVIDEARVQRLSGKKTVLFVDEIHRFNKAQQDAFLHHVESGLITLIGATTENPSFEVIPPLLSRCRVITLKALSEKAIGRIIDRALSDDQAVLAKMGMLLEPEARNHLIRIADGDARSALNGLELAASVVLPQTQGSKTENRIIIRIKDLEQSLQKKALLYDKTGEEHYNLISALHKSLRGSDPDAAIYWLARMLAAGEDPLYIARRMIRFAAEDIGCADPQALTLAVNAMEAFKFIGPPEGELALVEAVVYLATSPKSNSLYTAYSKARKAIQETGALPVPLHIRNAPTPLMEALGYGKGYRYAHDFENAVVDQNYLPEPLKGRRFYYPTGRGHEATIRKRLETWQALLKTGQKDPKEDT